MYGNTAQTHFWPLLFSVLWYYTALVANKQNQLICCVALSKWAWSSLGYLPGVSLYFILGRLVISELSVSAPCIGNSVVTEVRKMVHSAFLSWRRHINECFQPSKTSCSDEWGSGVNLMISLLDSTCLSLLFYACTSMAWVFSRELWCSVLGSKPLSTYEPVKSLGTHSPFVLFMSCAEAICLPKSIP